MPQADDSTAMTTLLVERAGRRIAFHDTPGRLPAILLDAGGGLGSSYWDAFTPELARRTGSRIISYDRPGFGSSDDVPGPWDAQGATDDLQVGLEALGATHDLILVAHSLAGVIAAYLAARHPTWIAGAVLVDANVPNFFTDTTIDALAVAYAPVVAATKQAPSTREGRQFLAVAESFAETSRDFHKARWPASIPIVNIVAEKTPFHEAVPAQWWRDGQAGFAHAADNRRLVVAGESSHDVVIDRPDVILQAIDDIIGQSRQGADDR